MTLVVDTGVLYAAADRDDCWHAAAVAVLADDGVTLIVPAPVVTETAWMIGTNLGPTPRPPSSPPPGPAR